MSKSAFAILLILFVCSTGCSSLLFKIDGTPAHELPDSYRAVSRNNRVPIDYRLLGQDPPKEHRIDSGDVLGITVEGHLPFSPPAEVPPLPPVNFPNVQGLIPSTGFPVVVQEDGMIYLPGMKPINARDLTLPQVRKILAQNYNPPEVSEDERVYPVVTLIQPRDIGISVVRQDLGSSKSSSVKLPIYRNDILNALLATGGLPSETAKDQVTVLRRTQPKSSTGELVAPIPMVDGTNIAMLPEWINMEPYTVPLTHRRNEDIVIPTDAAILNEGDIMYIESRESEVFYTSGLLPGKQHLLPRDYDIDIFEAMSIAGYSYGRASAGGGGGGGGGLVGMTGVVPTQLFVFRKVEDGCEMVIKVDLERAICDPRERLIVKAGDKLYLRYSQREELANFGIFAFFTFGIRQLFQN